jgi:hypothetical protein
MFSIFNGFTQIDRTKSSVRRRYSARYVVHRDYLGDCKKLFGTPVQDLASKTLNCQKEAATRLTLEDPVFHILEEQKMVGIERSIYSFFDKF